MSGFFKPRFNSAPKSSGRTKVTLRHRTVAGDNALRRKRSQTHIMA
jgi:hypothetical protein